MKKSVGQYLSNSPIFFRNLRFWFKRVSVKLISNCSSSSAWTPNLSSCEGQHQAVQALYIWVDLIYVVLLSYILMEAANMNPLNLSGTHDIPKKIPNGWFRIRIGSSLVFHQIL